MTRPFLGIILMALLNLSLFTCCSDSDNLLLNEQGAPLVVNSGNLQIDVIIPESSGIGLKHAANDLIQAFVEISGASNETAPIKGSIDDASSSAAIDIIILSEENENLGEQGYTISKREIGLPGLTITANTEVGAAYGFYHLISDLGVRYIHPEENYFPSDPEIALPWTYDGSTHVPSFDRRGFHEHTQHPIPLSDFLLRPGNDDFRTYLSHYMRWLARNRQNVMSWMMLKTVDMEAWIPYITDVVDEAHEYGIHIGMFVSYVDQQQNGYKIIREDRLDPDTDLMQDPEEQIVDELDLILPTGMDFIGFQIGSSEFTKPDEADMLSWLDLTAEYIDTNYNGVRMYTWIHTTCDLESDDGGYYYHLPLQSDERIGAYVHTTMFYDLEHPAPVYSCENFHQQVDFMTAADGKREQVYFPETAWWLGFDNNTPIVLPITNYTRSYDISQVLPDLDVTGHVTFTSGREWTYWQYDYFLTRSTWDSTFTWQDYLDYIKDVYAENASTVATTVKSWTNLQVQHFLVDNPLLYFYVAGELKQDEIGEVAGILARRPKIGFRNVLEYSKDDFNTWKTTDYDKLVQMEAEYRALFEDLPETMESGTDQQKSLYNELYRSYKLFVMRLQHVIELYSGVTEARVWYLEKHRAASQDPVEEPNSSIRESSFAAAGEHLANAQQISQDAIDIIRANEALYRYPVEILAREKTKSPTSYPYGYLEQCYTGHFWTRRDKQLEDLIGLEFDTFQESWDTVPDQLFSTNNSLMDLLVPNDPVAGSVIKGFIPQLLFGISGYNAASNTMKQHFALDYNENLLPDLESEQVINGSITNSNWEGTALLVPLIVRDSTGAQLGTLDVYDASFRLELQTSGDAITNLVSGELEGEISGPGLVNIVVSVGGIDYNGAEPLIKSIYGIDSEDPLPERLPMHFQYSFEKEELAK